MPADLMAGMPTSVELPPEAVAMHVLNMATESGLPHFHRLLATHLGESSALSRWTNIWTAEEHRHGVVMYSYALRIAGVSMAAIERLCYEYIVAGFHPEWQKSPYQLLAYTVLQELATQRAHSNVPKLNTSGEVYFSLIPRKIAGEEFKHHLFYRDLFGLVLRRDPAGALKALARVIGTFGMPGATIPGFESLSYLAARLDVFDALQFKGIVEGVIRHYKLGEYEDCPAEARKALGRILNSPAVLERKSKAFALTPPRVIATSFIPGWSVII